MKLIRHLRSLRSDRSGISLIESLVAIAVVASIGLLAMSALTVAAKASGQARTDTTATVLARSEFEYVRSLPVSASYSPDPTISVPSGYTVTLSATTVSNCLQLVTVQVTRPGHPAFTLQGYKPQTEHSLC